MPAPALRLLSASLRDLPQVWQGQELAGAQDPGVATGYPLLDAELPGGGWPLGLIEVLQERPEQQVWQLTAPALAQRLQSGAGPVVLVGAPFDPFISGLQAQGLDADRLLWIRAAKPIERLWAAEQALRCAEVRAVLAWLPQSRGAELRRLQLAAQRHRQLLFVFRPLRCLQDNTPARVRLQLSGTLEMQVQILKRRGPPLPNPLRLPAHPVRLAALLEARRSGSLRSTPPAPAERPEVVALRRSDVLDRIAAHG
jgi:protein ImuA